MIKIKIYGKWTNPFFAAPLSCLRDLIYAHLAPPPISGSFWSVNYCHRGFVGKFIENLFGLLSSNSFFQRLVPESE